MGARLEEVVATFRGQLVRLYGEPWYLDREPMIERLAGALVASNPRRAERLQLVRRWCSEGIPQLERWLADLETDRAA
jgi:hypothetical protein